MRGEVLSLLSFLSRLSELSYGVDRGDRDCSLLRGKVHWIFEILSDATDHTSSVLLWTQRTQELNGLNGRLAASEGLRWNDRRAVNLHGNGPTEELNRDDEQTLLRLAPDQDAFDACQEALCDADPVPFWQIHVRPSWEV